MSKTIGNLKDSVSGLLQGAILANITNLNGALERAARVLAQKADVPEASGKQSLTLYNNVFDYPAPTTIFGGALVDIRPQGVSRNPIDYVYKKPVELFDRTKHLLPNGYMVTFESNNVSPIMRIAQNKAKQCAMIDQMSATTGWVATGSASTPVVDNSVFYEEPGSLRFTLTGSSTGILTKTLSNSLSLSTYEDVGVVFLALRIPVGTNLSSIVLKIGSSASNYNSVTATQAFLGAFASDEWQLVSFDLSTASQVGTPNFSAINYIQISVAHTATITNARVGNLFMSLPSPHDIYFQSAAIFNVNGTLSNTITDDNDIVNLNDSAYTIYEHECALTVALQSGGKFGAGTVGMLDGILNGKANDIGLYARYRADNPSEELRSVGNYYND
jgi:hypothetical protein